MKILIAYYSRTGTTKKVAEILAQRLGADIEEIKDGVDRKGAKGYLLCGKEATFKQLTTLEVCQNHPANYDLVILGSPIWSWNISSPIRTYLEQYNSEFTKIAFFCTMGGSGLERATKEVEKITNQKVIASLGLTTLEVVKNEFAQKAETFANEILSPREPVGNTPCKLS
jgi:flavodoxin